MYEIQIDAEVMRVLEETAIKEWRPFAPHNEILRILLGLDRSTVPDVAPVSLEPDSSIPEEETVEANTDPQGTVRTHQRIGPRLLREHRLTAEKGYFSKTGVAYAKPSRFPGVLFDPDGYLMVKDEPSMRESPYINVGKAVSIPGGISSVPGYVTCGHTHE